MLKCLFWHKWSPWSEAVSGYNRANQFRACKKCNTIQHREIGYYDQVKSDTINQKLSEVFKE